MLAKVFALPSRLVELVRRSLREFVGLPLVVVAGFVVLFVAAYLADNALRSQNAPMPLPWLGRILGDSTAISSLLGTVATGMITVTSITFSLLLIAVQQTASSLSTQVYDQFVQRRSNKFSFGFFVGLSIFVLFTLGSSSATHRPVIGATLALGLTSAALCMIVILIYSTIDQMRPASVVDAIHTHTIAAREVERGLLQSTRRTPDPALSWSYLLRAERYGVVGGIDFARIEQAVADQHSRNPGMGVEVEIVAGTGTCLALRDPFVRLHANRPLPQDLCTCLEQAVRDSIEIEPRRTLEGDAGFGIEQLYSIAWTTASTAKQNPQPAILVCHALRDLIVRWSQAAPIEACATSRIVYRDRAVPDAIRALVSTGVVSSESMQNTVAAEVWRTLATLIEDAPPDLLPTLTGSAARLLSALGDHVMTYDVEQSVSACGAALRDRGETKTAGAVDDAVQRLGASVGKLNARGTRVSQAA